MDNFLRLSDTMVHSLNTTIKAEEGAEIGRSLWAQNQPGLHSKFHTGQKTQKTKTPYIVFPFYKVLLCWSYHLNFI